MLTKKEVKALLHYKSDSGFHEFLKRTPTFPKPVKLGLRCVGWSASEWDFFPGYLHLFFQAYSILYLGSNVFNG
ncbi:helix-turn-helix transcriptional regulator [Morganella morganii]|uniref:helix-turn-helix transcriptional regulator n=1 Tax=Morganella morganii TaxID=582 RepID=UPI002367A01F|nr:AlpA family phage regulatory protein [Morganella morganii]